MQIERLRLAGFKSFVEPTELAVEPGLTGIVGPNGCGKSNLVDALTWVMGEASAKRLRGGEMDDVIFAGSGKRPGRNIAEVVLTIDNSGRAAPFSFNDRETIEVVRRIERGGGSSYRINGRDVRARDVQLLFADAATGPHSGALVSQGRIGALISARPTDRRLLLDEAAGTSGLHARRHEAELKLKAAEENLLRLDDVLTTMAAQLDGLKKQARHAQRYRRLAEQIRRAEAQLLAARWRLAAAEVERVAAELREAERAVAAATQQAVGEERERAAAEEVLPQLRMAEASASAVLQRLAQGRAALEQELARCVAAKQEAERRLAQLSGDLAREAEILADAEAALARLSDEQTALDRAGGHEAARQAEAAALLEQATADLANAETGLQQMTEARAGGEARRAALERQARDAAERQRRLDARLAEATRQRDLLLKDQVAPEAVAEAATAVVQAEAAIDGGRAAAAATADALHQAQAEEAQAADRARDIDRSLARLKAEADALASVLGVGGGRKSPAVADSVLAQMQVAPGFEAAVAALFEGELNAPALASESRTASGWRDLDPLDVSAALPEAAQPLTAQVAGPAALRRRLSQTGWVENEALGWQLHNRLLPGQRLVDRDGRLWRWDGFVRLAGEKSAVAQQLRQRNRLTALSAEIAVSSEQASEASRQAVACRSAREQAAASERAATAGLRAAEERLAKTRAAEAAVSHRRLTAEARLAGVADTLDKLDAERAEIAAVVAEAERGLALLPDPGLARAGLEAARAQTASARRREGEARAALDRLAHEAAARQRRIEAIGGEFASWRKRRDAAVAQHAALAERRVGLASEIAEWAARPTAIAAEGETLARRASEAAGAHRGAADALALAETRLRQAAENARRAEQALAGSREQRARLDAQREAGADGLNRLRAEIEERLGVTPEELPTEEDEATEAGPHAARLEKLMRERDAMGPVNLLAEKEASEVEERIAGLQHERGDLTEAIARLRRGIASLDQEARKRVIAAFERLNGHFGDLFARLFGGGSAHLALAEGADPLDAGLEIWASPPGKRLQNLSLLSGGEQALTAIALIFAVFLTNPAPICVLDEVDAPLDDANVDRFCRLVADIADTTRTRFLVITHHRITMARMDRLFGVTMPERGVSQLVSVDLARAAEMRRTA